MKNRFYTIHTSSRFVFTIKDYEKCEFNINDDNCAKYECTSGRF
jgi:hypothetical protein